MRFNQISAVSICVFLLSACGGGGGSAPDTMAPTISGVSVSPPSNGQVTLTASASDATGVTGYCFKTDATAPTASDSCFTALATKLIATPSTTSHYYLWAKDAAGNLSLAFDKTLTDGVAPTISGVSVSPPSNGQVTLTASASDATGVTGYCFKTDATAPSSSDSCFQAGATTTVSIPQTAPQYVWAKDAAGNIGTSTSAGCSATGVTASQSSTLPTVCVSTSLGEFVLALESTRAPFTTDNFLSYVNDGFYSQTVFHRVIANFMIQGGGYTSTGVLKPTGTKPRLGLEPTTETGLSNTRGTIAMARTSVLDSATSQFFINVVDNVANTNNNLDGSSGYAVFGYVISGMNTADSIRYTPVTGSVPNVLPVINWAYQLK